MALWSTALGRTAGAASILHQKGTQRWTTGWLRPVHLPRDRGVRIRPQRRNSAHKRWILANHLFRAIQHSHGFPGEHLQNNHKRMLPSLSRRSSMQPALWLHSASAYMAAASRDKKRRRGYHEHQRIRMSTDVPVISHSPGLGRYPFALGPVDYLPPVGNGVPTLTGTTRTSKATI